MVYHTVATLKSEIKLLPCKEENILRAHETNIPRDLLRKNSVMSMRQKTLISRYTGVATDDSFLVMQRSGHWLNHSLTIICICHT